jgi:hypothetical protein
LPQTAEVPAISQRGSWVSSTCLQREYLQRECEAIGPNNLWLIVLLLPRRAAAERFCALA